MTYFPDLSPYTFVPSSSPTIPTMNIGWLETGQEFAMAAPSEDLLDRLWQFCSVSVWPTRGCHFCPFCGLGEQRVSERNGVRFNLGSAEIRVFANGGTFAFAAPNLVYHYVEVHHYRPPFEFLEALESGPQPTTTAYQETLGRLELQWMATPPGEPNHGVARFVKRDGKVEREWLVKPKVE